MQNLAEKNVKERVRKVIKWLISERVVLYQKDVAKRMNYNASVMSNLLNGNGRITDRFIERLCDIDTRLNPDWIRTGNGDMLEESHDNNIKEVTDVETFDVATLLRIIEGQTKTIGFVMDYLRKVEDRMQALTDRVAAMENVLKRIGNKGK